MHGMDGRTLTGYNNPIMFLSPSILSYLNTYNIAQSKKKSSKNRKKV
jgi:hypothetical protein